MSASPRPRAGKPSVWVFDGYLMAERETTAWNTVKALQTPENKGWRVFDGYLMGGGFAKQDGRESSAVGSGQCSRFLPCSRRREHSLAREHAVRFPNELRGSLLARRSLLRSKPPGLSKL